MSGTDGTCEYVLDPDDPETWGGELGDECHADKKILTEENVWSCPHSTSEGHEFCIFHKPIEQKKDVNVVKRLLDVIRQNGVESVESEFLGAKFGNIDISDSVFGTKSEVSINLKHSRFFGKTNFEDADITNELLLDGAIFYLSANFNSARFREDIYIEEAVFNGKVSFMLSIFEGFVDFTNSIFRKVAFFSYTQFKGGCNFNGAYFGDSVYFNNSLFDRTSGFVDAKFSNRAYFLHTEFLQSPLFQSTVFQSADFRHADLSGANFENAILREANFKKSDLTNSNLSNTVLSGSNLERSLLSRADLFESELIGSGFYGAVFGDTQINEETEFGDRCVYDPEFDNSPAADIGEDETDRLTKAAGQYRIIEQLTRTNAFPDMVSHNFTRRQDIHRKQHRQEGRWGRWLRATASKYILEYGENPWRLIVTGLIIVGTFGVLYPLTGGLQPTDGSTITLSRTFDNPILLLQGIYYSALTFTTLGMGDFLPVGLGRVLTTIETSLGAIIIALFVFVFGRRAAR